jgi:hypothetical protein
MAIIDKGYTVERAKSGLGASTALAAGDNGRSYWSERVRFWEAQLAFAEKAGRHEPQESH